VSPSPASPIGSFNQLTRFLFPTLIEISLSPLNRPFSVFVVLYQFPGFHLLLRNSGPPAREVRLTRPRSPVLISTRTFFHVYIINLGSPVRPLSTPQSLDRRGLDVSSISASFRVMDVRFGRGLALLRTRFPLTRGKSSFILLGESGGLGTWSCFALFMMMA